MEIFWLGFGLAVAPGPDSLLMTAHTLSYGRRIGYMTLLGNRLSLSVHMTLAILGLSVILQRSSEAFFAVRMMGALYLVYLGVRSLRRRDGRPEPFDPASEDRGVTPFQAVVRGFLCNLLNPKVSLFFFSIFPLVASPERLAAKPYETAALFFAGNSLWYVPLLALIGIRPLRRAAGRLQRRVETAFGGLFIVLGLRMIWTEMRRAL